MAQFPTVASTDVNEVFTSELDDLKRKIERIDREIDGLVYDLYGLTEEERQVVEGRPLRLLGCQ